MDDSIRKGLQVRRVSEAEPLIISQRRCQRSWEPHRLEMLILQEVMAAPMHGQGESLWQSSPFLEKGPQNGLNLNTISREISWDRLV